MKSKVSKYAIVFFGLLGIVFAMRIHDEDAAGSFLRHELRDTVNPIVRIDRHELGAHDIAEADFPRVASFRDDLGKHVPFRHDAHGTIRDRCDDYETLMSLSHRPRGVKDGRARWEREELPFDDVLRVEDHSVRRNVKPGLSLCPPRGI